MYAVIRMFSGSGGKKLLDLLEGRKSEVDGIIRPVKGFVSYSLIRTADGMVSVTVTVFGANFGPLPLLLTTSA